MKIEKSIITSIRTSYEFTTSNLVQGTGQMNKRIEKNIEKNETNQAQSLRNYIENETRIGAISQDEPFVHTTTPFVKKIKKTNKN